MKLRSRPGCEIGIAGTNPRRQCSVAGGDLMAKLGLSISQLNRLFARDIGKIPAEYWEERRVATARQALQESRLSIKTVAYDLGFSSLPHFSKWVKKKIGKSPRAVRNSMQEI